MVHCSVHKVVVHKTELAIIAANALELYREGIFKPQLLTPLTYIVTHTTHRSWSLTLYREALYKVAQCFLS